MLRVFPLLACALGPALFVFAQSPVKSPVAGSIGVFMDFESTPGAASVDAMKKEVDELLKPSGVSLDWQLTSENRGDQAFADLVVLKFKGVCKADGTYDPVNAFGSIGETAALGSTKVENGRVLPYSEVQCDEVRKALSYLAPGAGQPERQRALGVAMGRVVAHEMYHILARTTTHAEKGLAKASHSLEDLISSEKMAFAADESRAIAAAVLKQ